MVYSVLLQFEDAKALMTKSVLMQGEFQMKQNKTKALREGAMMVALTIVLILVTQYVPFLSVFSTLACGIPMGTMAARNGMKGIVPAIIAVFLVAILVTGTFLSAVSVILMAVVPGTTAGYVLGKKKGFFSALFATCTAVCVGWLFELFVLYAFVGNGIDDLFAQTMKMTEEMMKPLTESFSQAGITIGNMSGEEFVGAFIESIGKTFRLYFPSIIIMSSVFEGYLIMRVCAFVIKRTKVADVAIVPFSEMKATRSMCFVGILCYLIGFFAGVESVFGAVIANAVFILYALIGICGLSLVDYKLKGAIKSAWGRFGIYFAVFLFGSFLMSFVTMALIILGVLDSSRDFRNVGEQME